jgi:uncharacterized protein YpmB
MRYKKDIIIAILVAISLIGLVQAKHYYKRESGYYGATIEAYKLNTTFRGIPKNTILEYDNGKFVPRSVSGYASKADYPDNWWIRGADINTMKSISTPQ